MSTFINCCPALPALRAVASLVVPGALAVKLT